MNERPALNQPVIELNNHTVSYRQHPALHHLSGQFTRGSLTAVVGPNGSGKSTLLKSLMGLVPIDGGQAAGSLAVHVPRSRNAYLPQLSEIDRHYPVQVRDCVLLGLWSRIGAFGAVTPPLLAQAQAALAQVGLEGFERRPLGTLSSGQLQRVLFARLLVQDAALILLDEPFNAVDAKTTAQLLPLVQQWNAQGRTVIAVLHDDAQVRAFFPQTLLLAREPVSWGATAEVLTESNLRRARAMAQAWDESAELCEVTP